MLFILTNIPVSFYNIRNYIFKDQSDNGVIVYIDIILIYIKLEESHDNLVKEVQQRLAKNDIVISPEKCISGEKEVAFLGYILTPEGIRMPKDKITAICYGKPRNCSEKYNSSWDLLSSIDVAF
jgi:hypothetical protein